MNRNVDTPRSSSTDQDLVLLIGDQVVDLTQRTIAGSSVVLLTELEAKLLEFLYRKSGRFVSREQLMVDVWGWKPGLSTRTIDTTIYRLRRKLGDNPRDPVYLISQYGMGYQLTNVEAQSEAVDICCWMLPSMVSDGVFEGFVQWLGTGPVIVGRSRSFETLLASAGRSPRLETRLDRLRSELEEETPRVVNLSFLSAISRISAGIDVWEDRLRVLAFPTETLPMYWRALGSPTGPEPLCAGVVVQTSQGIELGFGDTAAPYAQLFVFMNQSVLDELGEAACNVAIYDNSASTYSRGG